MYVVADTADTDSQSIVNSRSSDNMETVVLQTDIARAVLGYLKQHKLDRAAKVFCKTSPHLKVELNANKLGLQSHNFILDADEFIIEYVKITQIVQRVSSKLSDPWKVQQCKLSQKVDELFERSLHLLLKEQKQLETHNFRDLKRSNNYSNINSNSCRISATQQSDKENISNRRHSENTRKRKHISIASSSDERPVNAQFSQHKLNKRRRLVEQYCFLNDQPQAGETSDDDECSGESNSDSEANTNDDSSSLDGSSTLTEDSEANGLMLPKLAKESTPRYRNGINVAASVKRPTPRDLSESILKSPEFQSKLVHNINEAFSSVSAPPAISSEDVFNQVIKNILEATEKDAVFDEIIEDIIKVVGMTEEASVASIQGEAIVNDNRCLAQPQQQIAISTAELPSALSMAANQQIDLATYKNDEGHYQPKPPQTPLIIRSAVASATAAAADCSDAAAASFTSLVDPNFSISKLIVLNSNEMAQKQPTTQHPMDSETSTYHIGNITAENIINEIASANPSEAVQLDDQICFDPTTGQLSFPIFLTNEGLLTNFPFLVHNEAFSQQLRPDSLANLDASRLEIPLPEPIIVSANQLPPNSMIMNSAQKQPPSGEGNSNNAGGESNEVMEENVLERTTGKQQKDISMSSSTFAPASLDSSRVQIERITPSASGIVNMKALRSLSTPRKRSSHVRTLTFSPRACAPPSLVATTTLTGRREQQQSTAEETHEPGKTDTLAQSTTKPKTCERFVIKNIEILPTIANSSSASDSNNSCTTQPFFLQEECSNQTVIKASEVQLSNQSNGSAQNSFAAIGTEAATPKRKQHRCVAVHACKRRLSKTAEEHVKNEMLRKKQLETKVTKELPPSDATEENLTFMSLNTAADLAKKTPEELMEEWHRMRSNTSAQNLDSRLREINAKSGMVGSRPALRNRRTRRRKLGEKGQLRRKRAQAKGKADQTNEAIESLNVGSENEEQSKANKSPPTQSLKLTTKTKRLRTPKSNKLQVRPGKDANKRAEFTIKITTPQKVAASSVLEVRSKQKPSVAAAAASSKSAITPPTLSPRGSSEVSLPQAQPVQIVVTAAAPSLADESNRRTSNIAYLLDTPFKDVDNVPIAAEQIPPTPGMPSSSAMVLDTPHAKTISDQELIQSTSYLFGSLTKSELDTPMLSAITPGYRAADKTDYSSGSSYYRPDESEEIDHNIHRMVSNSSAQKQQRNQQPAQQYQPQKPISAMPQQPSDAQPEPEAEPEVQSICVELPVEELKVEPTVLRRVKSFGTEAVDSNDGAFSMEPHYKLVSGLPDLSVAEYEDSSSSSSSSASSTSSSSSSSTSSNASSSSSSSSSTSTSSTSSIKLQHTTTSAAITTLTLDTQVVELLPPTLLRTPTSAGAAQNINTNFSLDHLSDISSTEDEEWKKMASGADNEVDTENDTDERQNACKLVSNDGEVRYPLRNWLTPSKDQPVEQKPPPTTIKVTLPLKSTEKQNRQAVELAQKRDRVLEKFRLDSEKTNRKQKVTTAVAKANKLATRKKLQALHDKQKNEKEAKVPIATVTQTEAPTVIVVAKQSHEADAEPPTEIEEPQRTIEVLTALNLSAKKQPPGTMTANNFSTKAAAVVALVETKVTQGPRKCVQIEAQPAPNKRCGSAKKSTPKKPKTAAQAKKAAATIKAKLQDSGTMTLAKQTRQPTRVGRNRACKQNPKQNIKNVDNEDDVTDANVKAEEVEKDTEQPEVGEEVRRPTRKASIKITTATKNRLKQQRALEEPKDIPLLTDTIATAAASKSTMATNKKSIKKSKKPSAQDGNDANQKRLSETEQAEEQNETMAIKPEKQIETPKASITTPQRKIKTNVVIREKPSDIIRDRTTSTKTQSTKSTNSNIHSHISQQSPKQQPDTLAVANTIAESNSNNNDNENSDFEFDITKANEQTIFDYVYNEDEHAASVLAATKSPRSTPAPSAVDFSNFQMRIEFDENETHTMLISQPFVLYHAAPPPTTTPKADVVNAAVTTIRNIPKKRRVRITARGSEDKTDAGKATAVTTTNIAPSFTKSAATTVAPVVSSTNAIVVDSSTGNNPLPTSTAATMITIATGKKVDNRTPLPPVYTKCTPVVTSTPLSDKGAAETATAASSTATTSLKSKAITYEKCNRTSTDADSTTPQFVTSAGKQPEPELQQRQQTQKEASCSDTNAGVTDDNDANVQIEDIESILSRLHGK